MPLSERSGTVSALKPMLGMAGNWDWAAAGKPVREANNVLRVIEFSYMPKLPVPIRRVV